MLFGFPVGRSVRVIGHQAGFAHIEDLSNGTRGWIEEAALAPPATANPEPRKRDGEAAAEVNLIPAPITNQQSERRVKRNDNRKDDFSGFLQRAFGGL
jgi:hypothetical protein